MREQLSNREYEILELIANEYSTNEIAEELFISPHTVISHRRKLLQKLNAKNSAGLIRSAFEKKIFALQPMLAVNQFTLR